MRTFAFLVLFFLTIFPIGQTVCAENAELKNSHDPFREKAIAAWEEQIVATPSCAEFRDRIKAVGERHTYVATAEFETVMKMVIAAAQSANCFKPLPTPRSDQISITDFVLIACLLIPAWFPAIRLFSLLLSKKLESRTSVWLYVLLFIWTAGGVFFQWVNRVPSGIGYLFVLAIAWPLLIVAIHYDMPPEKTPSPPRE